MATRCGDYGTQDSVPIKGINICLNMDNKVKTIDFIGRDDGNIDPMEIRKGENDDKARERVVCYAGNEGRGVGKEKYIKIAFKPEFKVLERHTKRKFYLQAVIKDGGLELEKIVREAITDGDRIEISEPYEFYMPDEVYCSHNMKIVFYAYQKDENKKMEVGIYSFNLYITWRKPGTGYDNNTEQDERIYYYSCTQAMGLGETDENAIIGAIWKKFQITPKGGSQPTGNLRMKDFDPREDDTQLVYYRTPVVENGIVALFKNQTADCGTFVQVFKDVLFVQGILSKSYYISTKGVQVKMLIKNWTFIGEGTSRDKDYPYRNFYKSKENNQGKEKYRDLETGKYLFIGNQDVVKEEGLAGQGNPNPIADFESHQIARVDSKYYDPSYGVAFNSFEMWVENAIAGFFSLKIVPISGEKKEALYFKKGGCEDLNHGDI